MTASSDGSPFCFWRVVSSRGESGKDRERFTLRLFFAYGTGSAELKQARGMPAGRCTLADQAAMGRSESLSGVVGRMES